MSRTVTAGHPFASASRVSVVLSYGPLGLVRATAHDIGDDGICVDTGRITLVNHTEVEIIFSFRRNGRPHAVKVPARVVGREGAAARLKFVSKEPGVMATLRKMMSLVGV